MLSVKVNKSDKYMKIFFKISKQFNVPEKLNWRIMGARFNLYHMYFSKHMIKLKTCHEIIIITNKVICDCVKL